MGFDLSWTQRVEAIQEQLETRNGLKAGLAHTFATAGVPLFGGNWDGFSFPNHYRYQLSLVFKEQCSEFTKLFRSSPTDS